MLIYRAYKAELRLNNKQKALCLKACGMARFAYNWGLQQCKEALDRKEKVPSGYDLSKRLNAIKADQFPWMYEVSKNCVQYAVYSVADSFKRFFAKQAKFPRFKSKRRCVGSFKMQDSRGGIKSHSTYIQLPRLGKLRLKEHGYIPTSGVKILHATVSEKAGRWYVSVTVEQEIGDVTPAKDKEPVVGVDLGIKTLATVSDGQVFAPLNPLRNNLRKLKRLQRQASRKQKGSNNRNKANRKVAKLHTKVANIRKHCLHELTTKLTKTKSEIVIEDLNVSGMMKNRKLSRAISDVGMYELRRQLTYKGQWYGCKIIIADRFYPSSKKCSQCGIVKDKLGLDERTYHCYACGLIEDRDLNAACNLRNVAVEVTETLNASGGNGSGSRRKTRTKPVPTKEESNILKGNRF